MREQGLCDICERLPCVCQEWGPEGKPVGALHPSLDVGPKSEYLMSDAQSAPVQSHPMEFGDELRIRQILFGMSEPVEEEAAPAPLSELAIIGLQLSRIACAIENEAAAKKRLADYQLELNRAMAKQWNIRANQPWWKGWW